MHSCVFQIPESTRADLMVNSIGRLRGDFVSPQAGVRLANAGCMLPLDAKGKRFKVSGVLRFEGGLGFREILGFEP